MPSVRSLVRWLTRVVPEEYRPEVRKYQRYVLQAATAAKGGRRPIKAERVVWLRTEVADIETVLLPHPGPTEVLVEIERTLVSVGTERAFLAGLPNASQTFPSGAGYSASGRVIEVGRRVSGLSVGQRVAGVAPHVSHAVGDADRFVPVPDDVPPRDASFVQLGAIAMHGLRRARISPGMTVAVVGLGLIGQLSIQLARWAGAVPIVGVARTSAHHEQALASGCDDVVALGEDPLADSQIGADVVIEASGNPVAALSACQMARDGGRVVLLGSSRGLTHDTDFGELVADRGLSLVGAHISNAPKRWSKGSEWPRRAESALFLDLQANRRVKVGHLVDREVAPSDANAVYEQMLAGQTTTLGLVFNWSQARKEVCS